jgi:glycosyltransferase involved in cell wall biosynthesis
MRLAIDARLLDNSGIGVYLSHILPRVVERCAACRPLVFAAPRALERVRALAGEAAECHPWSAPPLTPRDLLPPPDTGPQALWWVPHYNVPLLSRAPLVATLHDILPLSPHAAHWPAAKRLVVRAWLAAICSRAVRILCSSAFTRDEVVRLAGIDTSRMDVVPLGVDMPLPPRTEETVPPYLLFVGLVKPHKNLSGLLRAFAGIATNIPHRLVVVGSHSSLRDVDAEALAMASRLAPRVELIESVPRERLASLMAGASALIQPSFYEGFGFPPLEAMALGTPVIAARAASLPELCGDAAILFDPHSADELAARIRELLADAPLRARLREKGLARAREFRWDTCADRTSDILLEAMDAKPRGHPGRAA